MIKMIRGMIIVVVVLFTVAIKSGYPADKTAKNILLLNSYHQGFAWTDSLTSGILKVKESHPEINLFIEYLNSQKFGQSNFSVEKKYIQDKYSEVVFDGILVTDNDALDFALKYNEILFSGIPVVFAGISNPENYPLEGSNIYGYKERGSSDSVVSFIKRILPEAKRALILTDKTTTGLIYRKLFNEHAAGIENFSVVFPESMDLDSICKMVVSESDIDAIYYIGISQDTYSKQLNATPIVEQVGSLAKVPFFVNDPIYQAKGITGGMFQSGEIQGKSAMDLLLSLISGMNKDSIPHINNTELEKFFIANSLKKFKIDEKRLPAGSFISGEQEILSKKKYDLLINILIFLSVIVAFLSIRNRQRRIKQRKSNSHLQETEAKKRQLEETSRQLEGAISELEIANQQLNETNTSLAVAKKKAEESDNLKSAFLANVSHEIRTPLNSIVGFSSLLSDTDLDEATRNLYIDLIESNTESLLVLIDEIIDLSKIEAQQLTIKKQSFSMELLIQEQCQIFSQNNKNTDVLFQVIMPGSGKQLFVNSDRVRVKQIFINLLSNALKFTNSGVIELGYLLDENQEIVFFVKDTGIGISKEFHQAIFHRFRKLNENSGKVFRGTGLGLAITQKLVGLLGGKIWLESELGKGTAFYFTLRDCELKEVLN